MLETTREERRWLAQNWSMLEGDPNFRQWLAGSDRAHGIVPRALRDVDTVLELLDKAARAYHHQPGANHGPSFEVCDYGACERARAVLAPKGG